MAISYIKGDLLTSDEKLIAHGCNSKGVMGSGIAKSIREKYPIVYLKYHKWHEDFCVYNENDGLPLGATQFVDVTDNLTVINCITQKDFGSNYVNYKFVSYDAIYAAFKRINSYMSDTGINEIGIPKIGAGFGGGDWEVISRIIETCMPNKQIRVYYL